MKKLLLIACICSGILTNAQEDTIKFGVKIGINIASFSGDVAVTQDQFNRVGLQIGILSEIPITEKFAFQPELLFSSQGAKYDPIDNGILIEQTIKLDYLNLPLMTKYYVIKGFSIQAGPQIGFLLSANNSVESLGIDTETDIKDEISNIDFGINLGLGYQLPIGIFIDGRYNIGLSDTNDADDDNFPKATNRVLQFSLGYKF
ncbi:porin family protein [Aquimarina gracilis]|uniref:Porin family protein n=1 Tax=Aquimarina gracilis TaxID=874422 RepID=A0ABU6A2N5_9FLAO|nr:porin family protein [Aquimarina gracilis]MEB3348300.1 porin family protein [Aquimarina gracilis]